MPDFEAQMHEIPFPLGLRPRSRCGSLQRSPVPLAVFKGPTSKTGRGRRGEEGKGEGERKEKGGPPNYFWPRAARGISGSGRGRRCKILRRNNDVAIRIRCRTPYVNPRSHHAVVMFVSVIRRAGNCQFIIIPQ